MNPFEGAIRAEQPQGPKNGGNSAGTRPIVDPVVAPPEQSSMDPYLGIADIGYAEIKEKVSVIEAAAACRGKEVEMPNMYSILIGSQQRYLGIENTNICLR